MLYSQELVTAYRETPEDRNLLLKPMLELDKLRIAMPAIHLVLRSRFDERLKVRFLHGPPKIKGELDAGI
jgi:hypothetical protein